MNQSFRNSDPTVQAPLHDIDYRDYELIVYQSYRDGNWEIYTQQGYGSAVNITSNPGSADQTPRINLAVNRIVFSSNRSGIYQIYTCNLDGSGLTQVTFNGSNSTRPAWFPDGSKLVYVLNQRYLDGQLKRHQQHTSDDQRFAGA